MGKHKKLSSRTYAEVVADSIKTKQIIITDSIVIKSGNSYGQQTPNTSIQDHNRQLKVKWLQHDDIHKRGNNKQVHKELSTGTMIQTSQSNDVKRYSESGSFVKSSRCNIHSVHDVTDKNSRNYKVGIDEYNKFGDRIVMNVNNFVKTKFALTPSEAGIIGSKYIKIKSILPNTQNFIVQPDGSVWTYIKGTPNLVKLNNGRVIEIIKQYHNEVVSSLPSEESIVNEGKDLEKSIKKLIVDNNNRIEPQIQSVRIL